LLTFFMLTTSFKPPEDVEIKLPYSHSELKLPELNTMTVHVSENKGVWLGFDSERMMVNMFGQLYKLRQAKEIKMEELSDLLIRARMDNPKIMTIVKADANVEYGAVADVLDILQKTKISRFEMVTNFTNK